jgi:hypothetical protein
MSTTEIFKFFSVVLSPLCGPLCSCFLLCKFHMRTPIFTIDSPLFVDYNGANNTPTVKR